MKRSRIVLAVLLAVGMAASATAGYLAHPAPVKEGMHLVGRVLAEHFRPMVAGGCEVPGNLALARAQYVDEQIKVALVRWLSPSAAYADPNLACRKLTHRIGRNLIVNAGEAFLVDAWQNLVELENMKFHGAGTTNTAAAEGDTALAAESTTVLNPDSTRATGSLTEASASVFRSVGTLTFDGSAALVEWGLFSQAATGGGTMFSRIVYSTINVASADSVQYTWDLTVEVVWFPLWSFGITLLIPRRYTIRLIRAVGGEVHERRRVPLKKAA